MKRILAALLCLALLCPVCLAEGGPEVSAQSAILMDAGSGRVLYEKDAHTKRLIASTTKLMTALVAVDTMVNLRTLIPVGEEDMAEGSSMYLKPGEEVTLEDLLYGLLLASGNDAALAIARGCAGDVETFVDWMNQRAHDLGMEDTHFANPNGLDAEDHYSTAYDMALLAREVLQDETLSAIVATRSTTAAGRSLVNHNKLLWRYEGCTGMKTGYTDEAGRTLVSSALRNGQTLICVTLKDPDDWDDHAALFDYGFSTYPAHLLARQGKVFRTLPVTGSLIPRVGAAVAADLSYPLTAAERVKVRITLPETVAAPVVGGTIAGKLTFLVGEETVGETYLLYDADIPDDTSRSTLFQRIQGLLFRRKESGTAALFLDRMI